MLYTTTSLYLASLARRTHLPGHPLREPDRVADRLLLAAVGEHAHTSVAGAGRGEVAVVGDEELDAGLPDGNFVYDSFAGGWGRKGEGEGERKGKEGGRVTVREMSAPTK